MATLDEKGLRKPEFNEAASVPVTLLDGQDWHFPRPYKIYSPTVDDSGEMDIGESWSLGEEYAAMMKTLDSAASDVDVIRAEFAAIRFLLGRNYDLTPADLGSLVQLTFSRHAPPLIVEMNETLRFLMRGLTSPKERSSDG